MERLAWKCVNLNGANGWGERRGKHQGESTTDRVLRKEWARWRQRARRGIFRTGGLFPEGRVVFWELTIRKTQLPKKNSKNYVKCTSVSLQLL